MTSNMTSYKFNRYKLDEEIQFGILAIRKQIEDEWYTYQSKNDVEFGTEIYQKWKEIQNMIYGLGDGFLYDDLILDMQNMRSINKDIFKNTTINLLKLVCYSIVHNAPETTEKEVHEINLLWGREGNNIN